jgi:hypothetical protein
MMDRSDGVGVSDGVGTLKAFEVLTWRYGGDEEWGVDMVVNGIITRGRMGIGMGNGNGNGQCGSGLRRGSEC